MRPHHPAVAGGGAPGSERDCEDLQADAVERALTGRGAHGAYGALVYLRSRDRRSLMLSMVAGLPVAVLEPFRRISVRGTLPAPLAHRSGRMVHLSGAEDTMRRFPQLLAGLPYAFASAYAPVTGAAESYGVLCSLWPATPDGVPKAARRHLRRTANRLGAELDELTAQGGTVEGPRAVVELPWPPSPNIRLGLFDLDLRTRALDIDDQVRSILDLPGRSGAQAAPDGPAEALAAAIDPEDLPRLRTALRRAAHTGQFPPLRVQVLDGAQRPRPVQIWGRVRDGGPHGGGPHLAGAILDIGTAGSAAQAVERMRRGVFSLDPEGRVDYANLGSELLLAIRREDLLGRRLWEALPWLADPSYEDRYRAAVISRQPTAFLAHRPPDNWLAFSLSPDAHGMTGTVAAGERPDQPASDPAVDESLAAHSDGRPGPGTRAGVLYHLLQLTSTLSEAVSVREVCSVVAEQILPAFGGQEVAIYLAEEDRLRLALQVGYPDGFLDPFEGTPVHARLPGAEALAGGSPIFFATPDELSASYPGITLDQMCAWAFLPLIASGRSVGSCILGFDEPHLFVPEERALLTALGGLVAQALERGRLYDTESTLARGLQRALLPQALPRLPNLRIAARYLPASRGMEIGGDWYDAITTPRGVCLVVGDVEGHNVAAAAIMGQLRSAVRAFVASGHPPSEALEHLNRLLPDLDTPLLASCCLIELDTASGRAYGVRAGHLPPVLRHPDGRCELLELGSGMLLGVDFSATYPAQELPLSPGSVLALYTDGLVERPGVPIELGVDRLRTVLTTMDDPSLESLADRLLADTLTPANHADDIALLLARWDG